jgi:RNA polymerase sigma factor (sigma-70 family)
MIESVAVARRSADRTAAYEQHRRYVLAVLSRRCRWLADDEREALLHDAWALMLEKERSGALDLAAMAPQQVRAYVTQTALTRALDESRRARNRDEPLGDEDRIAAPTIPLADVVDADVEAVRVREILGELSARQQTIIKLRYFFDRSPNEVQALLGITERAYRRDLERALALVGERFALVREGRFCESRGSLIRAYVAGIAGPNRMRKAREHLTSCPACRHYALELRLATGKVAALAPVPVLTVDHERFSAVVDAVVASKQHAVSLAARVDPASPVTAAGARPGALAAALGACLALGGGATYCVVEGLPGGGGRGAASERVLPLPPTAALSTRRIALPAPPPTQARRPAPRPATSTAPAGAASSGTSKATKKTKRAKKTSGTEDGASSTATTAASSAAKASAHEFGFEQQPSASAPAKSVAPAPKRTAAAREFGP